MCGPPRFYTALAAARAAGDALRRAVARRVIGVGNLRAVVVGQRDHTAEGIVGVGDAGGVGEGDSAHEQECEGEEKHFVRMVRTPS
jgi:hypothetical protein